MKVRNDFGKCVKSFYLFGEIKREIIALDEKDFINKFLKSILKKKSRLASMN